MRLPLPPGTLPTLWGDDDRYVSSYLSAFPGYYLTGDGGYIVARVSGVVHPVPNNDMEFAGGIRQLSGEIASDVTVSLAKAEQLREGLTLNQKLVDTTIGNSGSGS